MLHAMAACVLLFELGIPNMVR
eukprot:COSAG05_NODE_2622_length_2830_cov_48.166239_1_plen_21_part_10